MPTINLSTNYTGPGPRDQKSKTTEVASGDSPAADNKDSNYSTAKTTELPSRNCDDSNYSTVNGHHNKTLQL